MNSRQQLFPLGGKKNPCWRVSVSESRCTLELSPSPSQHAFAAAGGQWACGREGHWGADWDKAVCFRGFFLLFFHDSNPHKGGVGGHPVIQCDGET